MLNLLPLLLLPIVGGYVLPSGISNVLDVKSFGAKCDGTTDDTAAIKAAIEPGNQMADNGAQEDPRPQAQEHKSICSFCHAPTSGHRPSGRLKPT